MKLPRWRSELTHTRGAAYGSQDSLDSEFHRHLQWALQHDISELDLELRFALESQFCGRLETFELCPNGQHQQVHRGLCVGYDPLGWHMFRPRTTLRLQCPEPGFGVPGYCGVPFFFLPQECGPESGTAGVWQPLDSVLQCFCSV